MLVAAIVVPLAAGISALYLTFTVPYESREFFRYSAILAACWVAVFAVGTAIGVRRSRGQASGSEAAGGARQPDREPVSLRRACGTGVAFGAVIGLISVVGALALSLIPLTAGLVESVLGPIRAENFVPVFFTALIVGMAEELAFRGGVFAALPARKVLWSTVIYALATAATLNPALVLAAVVLGAPLAWLRARTGHVLASVAAHAVWTCVTLGLLTVIL
ncbi:hypothetical protein GCM10022261_19280 [Brevibacterium daeguense]|uniref:CAAX prenyl protease 2/Lysostaphin resistance protein A-like domain-containing protein n=1 Tax=Brevibacterium daeguense TaxID=909936 RepID=A0ABP8EK97_9MICO